MKIKIEGLLPAVGSKPIYDWEIYVDGEPYEVKTLYDNQTWDELEIDIEPKKHEEEGEKMLNIDRYRNDLVKAINGSAMPIEETICVAADKDSYGEALSWLFSKYEPPLLENGDALKPGDWIMVKDDDDEPWTNVQFLAYIDGVFYTREPLLGGTFKIKAYLQACLLMEGE